MIRLALLMFLLSTIAPAIADKTTNHSILVVGDSISAAHGISLDKGWVNLLASKITQGKFPYQVINASITGDTTVGGLNRLPALLTLHQPDIVILELGGNDGLRGLPLSAMKDNLNRMISLSKLAGAKVILAGMKIPPNYGKRFTDAFYQIYLDLAESEKTGLIPFLLEDVGGHTEYMQADGIHPNEKAQPLIVQTAWPVLLTFLKN